MINDHLGKSSDHQPLNLHEKIAKLGGTSQEEHHRVVEAILKNMGVKDDELNDYERLLSEARSRIKIIRQLANTVVETAASEGKDVDSKLLAAETMKHYIEGFSHYTKDQLHILLCQFLAELTLRELG